MTNLLLVVFREAANREVVSLLLFSQCLPVLTALHFQLRCKMFMMVPLTNILLTEMGQVTKILLLNYPIFILKLQVYLTQSKAVVFLTTMIISLIQSYRLTQNCLRSILLNLHIAIFIRSFNFHKSLNATLCKVASVNIASKHLLASFHIKR